MPWLAAEPDHFPTINHAYRYLFPNAEVIIDSQQWKEAEALYKAQQDKWLAKQKECREWKVKYLEKYK